MARVLITGATGMIGTHLTEKLADKHEVFSLGRRASVVVSIKHVNCDLARNRLPQGLPDNIDTVIHLAQSAHFREFPDKADDIFSVNVSSTQLLLDWARRAGATHFVYASSGGIYGHGRDAFREDDLFHGGAELGYYLASKRCAEMIVESYASCFTVAILRFFFVYGPRQGGSMLMPRLVRAVQHGRPITLQGQEGIRINPIHVSDAVRCIEAALGLRESEKVNVAGGEVVSLRALGELIGLQLAKQPAFEFQPGEPRHLIGDTEKMRRLLASPTVTLEEGLRSLTAPISA